MSRLIRITLEKRQVSCVARLLDDLAPATAQHVWDALPQASDAVHAKFASNEVYCLVRPLPGEQPGLENPTLTPIPGDVAYFDFPIGILPHASRRALGFEGLDRFVDLAIFYGRNNLLFDPANGPVPANIYASIVDGLDEMAAACDDVWRNGFTGERLRYARHE